LGDLTSVGVFAREIRKTLLEEKKVDFCWQ
jgi:hypothetical protein